MKTGTFILSWLIVVLTIQPMFIKWENVPNDQPVNSQPVNINSPSAGCCKKNIANKCSSKKQRKEKSDNPCNACNPFMPCNACGYLTVEADNSAVDIIVVNADNTIGADDFILSTYDSDCWHPPELFSIL